MADQLLTLRPDVLVRNGWGWGLPAITDDSDTTWADTVGSDYTVLGFPPPSIPLGARITSVRPRFRGRQPASGNAAYEARTRYRMQVQGAETALSYLTFTDIFDPTTLNGTSYALAPNGQVWDSASVGAMEMALFNVVGGSDPSRFFELYLDVFYNRLPTVAVTGPADEDAGTAGVQVTSTQQPLVAWTFTDEDGDLQRAYQLKVFTDATYLAGGFDPASSPAAYDSGVVYNSASSVTTGTLSFGDTYRAYVRAYDGVQWSNWALREFSIGSDPSTTPSVPTLSAIADPDNSPPRVELIVTPQGTNPSEAATVERQNDDGTWQVVVNRSPGSGPQVLYDYGAPGQVVSTYRARTHIGTLASGWSATATSAVLSVTQWWLVDRLSPELSVTLVMREYPTRTSRARTGIFYPLGPASGRTRAVAVSDSVTAEVLTLNLGFATDAAYEAFDLLRRGARPLLLRDPRQARQWWVALSGDRSAEWIGYEDDEWQDVTVEATEIKEPV